MLSAQERVGTTVGGCWRLDALLGVGGTAAVYAATHASGRRAAFKVLRPELALDYDVRERFLREFAFAKKLEHPCCVRVEGTSRTDDGALTLLMELLEGETLEARWRREGQLPALAAFELAARLLAFLQACHGRGVVHRDLKPSNVFLTSGGELKVLDFGIARDSSRARTAANLTLGTPAYMAPEQALALHAKVDGRTDLFAVGAILYTIITGRSLRRGPSSGDRLGQAAREAAAPIGFIAPMLPVEVARVIDRALEWEPSARYANAAAMRADVSTACEALEGAPCPAIDDGDGLPAESEERPTTPDARAFAMKTVPVPASRAADTLGAHEPLGGRDRATPVIGASSMAVIVGLVPVGVG